jgi:hypothetical protein
LVLLLLGQDNTIRLSATFDSLENNNKSVTVE